MINPYQHSDSHNDLLKLMIRRAQQAELDNRMLELLRQFFDQELGKEHMPLSRAERNRLFRQVAEAIWAGVLGRIDGPK